MRVRSFLEMESEYTTENGGFEGNTLDERKNLLSQYKLSVIVEGRHNEFDNLDKWIAQNISKNGIENIYYGKTGYDYGFAEYFMNEKQHEEIMTQIAPRIFTTYPNAYPTLLICKSDGYQSDIKYDGSDKDAIIFPAG